MGGRGKRSGAGVRADARPGTGAGVPDGPATTPNGPGGVRPHDPGYDAIRGLSSAAQAVKDSREKAEANLADAKRVKANPAAVGAEYEAGRKARAHLVDNLSWGDRSAKVAEAHRYNARRQVAAAEPGPAKNRATAGYKKAAQDFNDTAADLKRLGEIKREARKLRIL